jgi:hypothetical protein
MLVDADKPYFNLVVVNDFFDTHERFKIFFRPMTERFPGEFANQNHVLVLLN